jgi:putative hemolysin
VACTVIVSSFVSVSALPVCAETAGTPKSAQSAVAPISLDVSNFILYSLRVHLCELFSIATSKLEIANQSQRRAILRIILKVYILLCYY